MSFEVVLEYYKERKMRLVLFLCLLLGIFGEEQSTRSRWITRILNARNSLFGKPSYTSLVSRGETTRPPMLSCGTFTRSRVIDCFDKLADTNCDYKLSAAEIDAGRKAHLTYLERIAVFAMTSTSVIMNACDKNKDGFIDHDEFLNQYEGCLNNEDELCHVRDICERELAGPHVCGRN